MVVVVLVLLLVVVMMIVYSSLVIIGSATGCAGCACEHPNVTPSNIVSTII
jgi:hypothetical protein